MICLLSLKTGKKVKEELYKNKFAFKQGLNPNERNNLSSKSTHGK